ncbi:hypothetical protein [Streptomyces sp. NPDC053427]|uniref:hypothetical protein n=1 Tax=Streptomyces sp. NPDC053427 TaxID=3365701 RepID=UPI0037D70959
MASHARPQSSRIPRTLLRAALTVSAAGAALAAGSSAAAGAEPATAPVAKPDHGADAAVAHRPASPLWRNVAGATGAIKRLQINPLANTPVDPLANAVGTQVADFKPVSTTMVTGTLSRGGALKDLPLVGTATRVLPG